MSIGWVDLVLAQHRPGTPLSIPNDRPVYCLCMFLYKEKSVEMAPRGSSGIIQQSLYHCIDCMWRSECSTLRGNDWEGLISWKNYSQGEDGFRCLARSLTLTHSLTHSLSHSLTHSSLTHSSLTHSPLTHSHSLSLTTHHSLIHSHSSLTLITHSLTTHSLSLTHHSLTHSTVHHCNLDLDKPPLMQGLYCN